MCMNAKQVEIIYVWLVTSVNTVYSVNEFTPFEHEDIPLFPNDLLSHWKLTNVKFVKHEHFIRNTIVILGRASLCSRNSLNSSCHRFHRMLETFWSRSMLRWWHHAISGDLSSAHSCCKSPVLPHPKSALGFRSGDWERVWGNFCFETCCIIMLEVAMRGGVNGGHEAM